MATFERSTNFSQHSRKDGRFNANTDDEVPVGELFRRLSQDASALVRDEIALAKVELRETAKGYTKDAAKLGIAAAVAWMGVLALTAFLVVGLGDLFNNYWLSSLIVAIAFLATGAMMAKGALAHMKRNSLAPQETVRTLKQDQQWAKHEAQEFKRQLKA